MKIIALAGGVGGAKLADGLYRTLPPEDLTVIVNTGDDFEHWGLKICPDLDTVCYTLAGLANPETGWGLRNETWNALETVSRLGGPDWFRIGDLDLGTHLERTRRLNAGETLSRITTDLSRAWGVRCAVLPMTDYPVATVVETNEGDLPFQEYFVHRRCEPRVRGFHFVGIESAQPAPAALEALAQADAIVLCPSNPWVSIDPILAVLGGIQGPSEYRLRSEWATVRVGVSPIVGGQAVKGPAAKMFVELGLEPNPLSVAQHYRAAGLSGLVLDEADAKWSAPIRELGIQPLVTNTLMKSPADRLRLARDVLNFVNRLLES
jgi:LPPG:FO 2-phospho-L-lactate transferase